MRLLWLAVLRYVARTPWTSATVLLGTSLGVASVVAVHLLSVAVGQSLEQGGAPHLAAVSHVAERPGAAMDDYFALRAAWRRGELGEVTRLTPVVEGHARLRIGSDSRHVRVVGYDWFAAAPDPGVSVAEPGAGGLDGVVIDARLNADVGEHIWLDGVPHQVSGRLRTNAGGAVFMDVGSVLALGGNRAELSYVLLDMADSLAWLRTGLEALLPGSSAALPRRSFVLDGWRVRPVSALQPEQDFAQSILFNLGALGSLSLVVAWFLIFQASVVWLRRQRTVFDGLHAIGVDWARLRRVFIACVGTMGMIATLIGLLLGTLLARGLAGVTTAGFDAIAMPGLDLVVVGKAAASGVLVVLAGAVLAWRRGPGGRALQIPALGIATGAILLLIITVGWPQTGLAGGFVAILAISIGGVWLVGPLLRRARPQLVRLRGSLLLRMGVRETVWHVEDLSVALSALALAVATSVGVSLMVESFRTDFQRMLDVRLAHDLFVDLDGREVPPLDMFREADTVQFYGRSQLTVDGRAVELGFTEFNRQEAMRYGHGAALKANQVLVSERLVTEFDAGETLTVGNITLEVVGVFPGFGDVQPRLLVDTRTARSLLGEARYDRVSLSGIDADALSRLQAQLPGARIQDRAGMRALALEIFDRTFAITRALTLLALVVAFFGLYNALVSMRLNQQASRQLLDAMGVSAREQSLMGLARAGTLAAVATVLALPIGIAMGWLLCAVVNPRAFGWTLELSVTVDALLIPVALGAGVALIAGLLPVPVEGRVRRAAS